MINQEFLSNCTDEQINKGVDWLEKKKIRLHIALKISEIMRRTPNGGHFPIDETIPNYCTNPNDAWPIIDSSSMVIGPIHHHGKQQRYASGCSGGYGLLSINANPLRAAMEVYILMSVES